MKNAMRIGAACFTVMMGMAATVHGQPAGRFSRVTTTNAQRNASSSAVRSGNATASAAPGGVARTTARSESLHPYSSPNSALAQGGGSGVPRYSSQPQPEPMPPTPRSQPRTYFPGMRSGRATQPPVTLTARTTGIRPICTPSRSQSLGGAHHR